MRGSVGSYEPIRGVAIRPPNGHDELFLDNKVHISHLHDRISDAIKDVKVLNLFSRERFRELHPVISQTVEYALRAVVTIAQNGGGPCTAQNISAVTRVPAPYLSKLMQGLVRAGVVSSQRGLHGGFVLTKAPEQLSIWDVVEAVEPLKRILECPLGIASHGNFAVPLASSLGQRHRSGRKRIPNNDDR